MGENLGRTSRSDIPRYLLLSDFGPFPFPSDIIMSKFQTVGMTQYFQMSVKIGNSQVVMGAPPGRRATPRIFPEPLLFRHDYGCVGPRDKGYIPVVHVKC